jgi:ribosome-binding factor A
MPSGTRPPSQRMLKVGEEVRHALAEVFIRGELHAHELDKISITVSEVRMTPDLKLAIAYIATLGGDSPAKILPLLNKTYEHNIRRSLIGKLHLKFLPQVQFRVDESFDEANKINRLLHQANGPTQQSET